MIPPYLVFSFQEDTRLALNSYKWNEITPATKVNKYQAFGSPVITVKA